MKFSTTPILLTSLALSSASALAAPVQTPNNLEVRSPNPDDFESPLIGSTNSPLLGGTSDDMGKKGWGKAAFDLGQGRPRNLKSGGNAGRSWSMKRQLAASNATPLSPLPNASTLTNSVQQQVQGTVQGLQTGLNGLLPNVNTNNLPLPNLANPLGGLGLGSTSQLGGTITGLTGTVGGVTGGLTDSVSGLTGTASGLNGGLGGLSGTVGGLTGSLGGLTNTAGGVAGAVGGLAGTANGLTGSIGGPSLNGLTGQLAGLTNGLPAPAAIVNGLPVVGGITNGLPVIGGLGVGSIGNTLNGVGGTASNLLGSATAGTVGLGAVTSTLGGLGLGDATKQLSGVSGTLGSLTGTTGILSNTAQGGSSGLGSTLSGLQSSFGSTTIPTNIPSVGRTTGSVTSQENQLQNPGGQVLGNIVQDLGNNTYLLSSGQVLNLPSQLSASLPSSTSPTVQSSTGNLTSLLSQGLSVAQVNGRMYVLNSLGQAIAVLPDSTKLGNVAGTGVGSYYQSPDQESSTNSTSTPADITHETGYNGPSLDGLTPGPSATDLVTQAMSGTEQTSAYANTLPAEALAEAVGATTSAPRPNVYHGNQRTVSHVLAMPTATPSATICQPIVGASPTAAITGAVTDAEWITASASSTAPTTGVTATSESGAWSEWVSAGTATTLWSGADPLPTEAPLGAIGSEMVPQMSSGLA